MRLRGRNSAPALDRRSMPVVVAALAAATISCSDPDRDRLKSTTKATYDSATGKLTELTFDANKNGRIDTWTEMDGNRPVRSRIDRDEDGRMDRWEYYDAGGKLHKVGFSRKGDGKPDAWAYPDAGGRIVRVESSSSGDEARIDRWEVYDPAGAQDSNGMGPLRQVIQDSNGDGKRDKWERYENGLVVTAEFDENGDESPDRRLIYNGAELVSIETAPDGRGGYSKKAELKK
jgi:hypothetical protein